jgi:hypothetical protein
LVYNEAAQWKLRTWSPFASSVLTLNQDNIIEMESVTHTNSNEKISKLKYRYDYNFGKGDFTNSIPLTDNLTLPSSKEPMEVAAPGVYDPHQARWYAFIRYLYSYRRKMQIELKCDLSAVNLEPGDIVTVNHPLLYHYGAVSRFFEVTSCVVLYSDNECKLTLLEQVLVL